MSKRKIVSVSQVSEELQCPVCLLVPRDVPIPACPVGHITCKDCRVNVTTCPTCRRQMLKDGTNTIANKMIERIPHSCKYGCQVKNYLKEIVEHEGRCPERTVKCPGFFKCNEQVKIREYHKHALAEENDCNIDTDSDLSDRTIRSLLIIEIGKGESQESLRHENMDWPMRAFEYQGKIFYFHMHYFSAEQTFSFYVTMAEHSSEAEKYVAKMTLKNQNDDRKSLSTAQNVISMDAAPTDSDSVLASKSVMFVHWRTMSGLFKWRGRLVKRSKIEATIDIL